MGIHVGGIHVAVKGEANSGSIADFVRAYWLAVGARTSSADPLQFETLSLEKTGELGVAVFPAAKDHEGREWVAIYDSERYTADAALAQALATHFDTEVWHYHITDSVNEACASKFCKDASRGATISDYSKTFDLVDSLPGSLVYFNQLKKWPIEKLAGVVLLAFESVPHRSGQSYSGPSKERLAINRKIEEAERMVRDKDADGLLSFCDDNTVYREAIDGAIEHADPANKLDLAFVYKLGPATIRHEASFCSVAEAALRMKDEKLFAEALAAIPPYSLYTLEQRAMELKDEPALAFRLIASLCGTARATPRTLNNIAYYLIPNAREPGIPEEQLRKILLAAEQAGPHNPSIYHNLACVYVRRGDHDKALECVGNAVRFGYELYEKMKSDTDLDPIRSDPRFDQAFADRHEVDPFKSLHVSRRYRGAEVPWVAPSVGFHLYFPDALAAEGAARLLEALIREFPEMFRFRAVENEMELTPTTESDLAEVVQRLRSGKVLEAHSLYFNALSSGGACDRRFFLELDRDYGGEISVQLPLDLASDPVALRKRLVGWASLLPFAAGNAGYSLSVCYRRGALASEDVDRLLGNHLGLTTSQSSAGYMPGCEFVVPNWLTFLGPDLARKAKTSLAHLPSPEVVQLMPAGGVVIQAALAPFFGLATRPDDLGYLPQIARSLEGFLPPGQTNNDYLKIEAARFARIKALP